MAKPIPVIINQFDGGMSEDKRSGWSFATNGSLITTNKYSITKHFDAFTFPKKLVPYSKTVATTGETKAYNIRKFCYTQGKFYGLGSPTSGDTSRCQVYENGGIFSSDSWSNSTNGLSTSVNTSSNVFFPYKTYIFVLMNGSYLERFDTAGGAWGNTLYSMSYTYAIQAEPVWHPSDDKAYFFADNVVHSTSDGASFSSVLTLPSNQRIVSACPWNDYLAIGCITTDTVNTRSIVYLWDRDSSLTTLSERIDFGEGTLKHLFNLQNKLIGVVDFYSIALSGVGDLNQGRVYIKQANGKNAVIVNELVVDAQSVASSMSNTRFVRDNVAFFPMSVKLNSDNRMGIWSVDDSGRITLAMVEEDLSGIINSIYATGNIWWVAHSSDGSVQRSSYTNADYSANDISVYETLIFTAGDSSNDKKLIGITVNFEPLPSAGSEITLKYRKNEETSWTTIFTYTGVGTMSHDAINIESTGATLPEFNEIQFQVLSSNGAVFTGLSFDIEIMDNGKY